MFYETRMLHFAVLVVYVGLVDATTEYPTNVTIQIQCHELSVKGVWNKAEFGAGNVTKIAWNDPTCVGFEENDIQFWATTNFSACQSVISENNDTVVQANTARVRISYIYDIIQRDISYDFNLRCEIQRSIFTPSGTSYTVTEKRFLGEVNRTATADFNIRMDIYSDATFTQILLNPTATSFDPIFISIREANDNELLKFVTQQCFATPSSDRSASAVSYTFFYNKCPVDESFQRIASSSKHAFNFKVDAFRFIRLSRSVYIHCRLSVCKANATSYTCTQERTDCNSRRRRGVSSLAGSDDSDENPLEEITVMTQRITFVEPSCKDISCPSFSSCVDITPPVCRCGHGYVLIADTNTCSRERSFNIYGIHVDMEFENSYRDPYSKSFVSLATRIEKQLGYLIQQLDDNTISGLKVIEARKGSVVVDLLVIRNESASENEAYATFLKAISESHVASVEYDDALTIRPITPTLERETAVPPVPVTLILCIVIPALVVAIIIAFVIKERRKLCGKSGESDESDLSGVIEKVEA